MMINIENNEIIKKITALELEQSKRGTIRINNILPNGKRGDSRPALSQEVLSIAILDQLITLNDTMANTYDLLISERDSHL